MKLKAGVAKYRLPPVGRINAVSVCHGITDSPTDVESLELERFAAVVEMNRSRGSGRPIFYTHDGVDIHLYPAPDRPGTLVVRYFPQEAVA